MEIVNPLSQLQTKHTPRITRPHRQRLAQPHSLNRLVDGFDVCEDLGEAGGGGVAVLPKEEIEFRISHSAGRLWARKRKRT